MTVYTIGWTLCFLASAATFVGRENARRLVWLALVYFCGVAFLRGSVGTDTSAYEDTFARILAGNSEWSSEGLFGAVGLGLCALGGSVEMGVRLLSVLFFGLLAIFCFRANRDELLLLSAYVLPVFAYQYSMNTLRIGLALAVLLLAVQTLRRAQTGRNIAGLFTPLLFHYTSIIASCYLILSAVRLNAKVFAVAFVVGVGVMTVFYFTLQDYALGKVQVYETFFAPSEASGLSRLIMVGIIIIAVVIGSLPVVSQIRFACISVILAAIFAAVTRDTAGGLRLLDMLSFTLPLSALLAFASASRIADNYFKVGLCLAGILGAVAVGKNFLDEAGYGNSPFVPYSSWMAVP